MDSHELPDRTQKTPRMGSSSACFIASNDDLLMQILVYLPIKSLFRFQWVSRRWFSIIADPFFRRLHSKASSASAARQHGTHLLYRWEKNRELIFVSDEKKMVSLMEETLSDVANLFRMGMIRGIHSCNGLVAISLSYNDADYMDIFVYNPASRRCKKIPYFLDRDGMYSPHRNFAALNIAFDPLQSAHYKLVCVSYVNSDGPNLWIYSSEFQVWSCHECPEIYGEIVLWRAGVFWNGDLHWICVEGVNKCLDLDGEGVKEVPHLPLSDVGDFGTQVLEDIWPDVFFFGQCGEDLCLMGLKEPWSLMFDVYKMELDYSQWTLKYCLDLSVLPRLYPLMEEKVEDDDNAIRYEYLMWKRCKFSVLSCIVENEKDQPVLMISLPGKVISCDTNGMIVKEIADVVPWEGNSMYQWYESFKYVETFASI